MGCSCSRDYKEHYSRVCWLRLQLCYRLYDIRGHCYRIKRQYSLITTFQSVCSNELCAELPTLRASHEHIDPCSHKLKQIRTDGSDFVLVKETKHGVYDERIEQEYHKFAENKVNEILIARGAHKIYKCLSDFR